jgi:hypothetical protein
MKKVSILLLLTVVLASFTFAIEGVGDFTAGLDLQFANVGGGNDGALDVRIGPSIKFARSFGGFGISAKLGDTVYIPTDKEKNGTDKIGDDLYFNLTPSYSLAAGPGTLGLGLSLQLNVPLTDEGYIAAGYAGSYFEEGEGFKNLFFRIDPSINYGLDAGFGALTFEVATESLQISKTRVNDGDLGYGLERLPIYFLAGADFSFGLGLSLKPILGLAIEDEDADTGLDYFVFDVNYAINEQISAGIETTIPTHPDNGIEDEGIEIVPYANFSFGALGAYLKIDVTKIGRDGADDKNDVQIKPIVGVTYKF